jgi:hypothetical protein
MTSASPLRSQAIENTFGLRLRRSSSPQARHVREVPRIDGKTRFFRRQTFDRLLSRRQVRGAAAMRKFLPLLPLVFSASQGLNLSTTKWRLAETPSDRLMATSPSKNDEDDVLSIFTQNLGRLMPTCMNSLYASKALEYRIMCSNRLLVTPRSGIARGTQYTLANDPSFVSAMVSSVWIRDRAQK